MKTPIFSPLASDFGGGRYQNVYHFDLICAQNVSDSSKSGVRGVDCLSGAIYAHPSNNYSMEFKLFEYILIISIVVVVLTYFITLFLMTYLDKNRKKT